jgi:transcriptional regulator with XRE-family HTH domain
MQDEDQFMKALGRRIAELRKQNNVTQEELAYRSGLDRVAIAYIENGNRKPKVSSIYKIAKSLGVTVEEVFRKL